MDRTCGAFYKGGAGAVPPRLPNEDQKMAKLNLKITTAHGTFTRSTATAYTHAVVRSSRRANDCYLPIANGTATPDQLSWAKSGVTARWIKDRGYAVTWHGSEQAARNAAAKPYFWDATTVVLGTFPVEA